MKPTKWLLSKTGVITTGTFLTLLVLAESIFPPWAPYFIIYALLAILIPLVLKTYNFGPFLQVLRTHWLLIAGVFAIAMLWDVVISGTLYEHFLTQAGLETDPFYSLNAAVVAIAGKAALTFAITPDEAIMIYALFILVWAPVGEELFYRGYMQGALRKKMSFWPAALISAAFFGIRHATHLFFLWPDVPYAAAGFWVVSTFVFGLLMSFLYEKTRSIYPLILVHVLINIAELMMG
jgi:membrane protease YdiL (CAAX protease family)